MVLRTESRGSVGSLSFRILYGGLSALSFAAVIQLFCRGMLTRAIYFATAIFVTCWFIMVNILKGICHVCIAAIGVAFIELKFARYRVVVIFGVGSLFAMTFLQQFMLGEWGHLHTMRHVIHRMAVGMPYYTNLHL